MAEADGSFNRYLLHSGQFVTTIALAIQRADPTNLERIRLAYPQMVAAFEHSSWEEAPPEFEPHYHGRRHMPRKEGAG